MDLLINNATHIWYNKTWLSEDPKQCFDIKFWQQRNAVIGSTTGRGTTWFVQTNTIPAALRHYYRGGLLGKLVLDNYFFTGWEDTRSAQEFKLLNLLQEKGISVPRPLAARAMRAGLTYQADLLMEKVDNVKNLVTVLMESALNTEYYCRIGVLIRKLHDASVCHADLNIHNILLGANSKCWLIDFDKCGKKNGEHWKASNLRRLLRSFRKERSKRQINWQESDWKALMQGYEIMN
ncbi:3-deoxy-D-manno-octulosonic acid kinase [Candidatus Enterovibrio altilux]|uniref:3-deoxy-D-manno-octulosonic acid kinase n=1 Tax=Candidatus Enterovibrio altilux TaxID=1927128 RepID=A0A291B8Q4_9GAMM|nr:3-deoxy-D-manno-octulosonic acid kinase [Candidatus Enterovibrio luxaltus]ATF09380.1 3-deoxy-D-manno-octulosonic acid kinase [Candidatus Enterovibrio luxaltus]